MQGIWVDWIWIFPKKIYSLPTGTWKGSQHHQSSGKCKSKPLSPHNLLKWLLSKRQEITCWLRCGEKGILLSWECKLMQPLWKTIWMFLKKLKIELPYDPAISILNVYSKEMKTLIQNHTCTPMLIAALFLIAKSWK